MKATGQLALFRGAYSASYRWLTWRGEYLT